MTPFFEKINRTVWEFRHRFSPIPDYDFNSDGELIHNYLPIQWTKEAFFELAVSSIIGALLGSAVSIVLCSALVELSLSSSFAFYFGTLFIIVGIVVIKAALSAAKSVGVIHPDEEAAAKAPRRHLIAFGGINIFTGLFCVLLQGSTPLSWPLTLRIISYGLLGMCLSFVLAYAIIDILNLATGFFRPDSARPLVKSPLQIYVVVLVSLLSGTSFGCLFAILTTQPSNNLSLLMSFIENFSESGKHIHQAKMIDLSLCSSIGAFWGLLAGLSNEYIRRVELAFNRLDQPVEFDCDI